MLELLSFLTGTIKTVFSGLNSLAYVASAVPAFSYHLVNASINYVCSLVVAASKIVFSVGCALRDVTLSTVEFLQVLYKFVEIAGVVGTYACKGLCILLTVAEHLLGYGAVWGRHLMEYVVLYGGQLWQQWKIGVSTVAVTLSAFAIQLYAHSTQAAGLFASWLYDIACSLVHSLDNRWQQLLVYLETRKVLSLDSPVSRHILLHAAVTGAVCLVFMTLLLSFLHYLNKHNCTFPLFSFLSRGRHLTPEPQHDQIGFMDGDSDSLSDGESTSTADEDDSGTISDTDSDSEGQSELPDFHEEFELANFSDSSSDTSEEDDIEININLDRHRNPYQRRSDSVGSNPTELRRRLEEEEESRLCVVCSDAAKSVLVLPCKHVCLCTDCALTIVRLPKARRHCPLCRSPITEVLDVFI